MERIRKNTDKYRIPGTKSARNDPRREEFVKKSIITGFQIDDTKKDVETRFRNRYTERLCIGLSALIVVLFFAKLILRDIYHIPFYVIIGTGAVLNVVLALRNRGRSRRLYDVFAVFTLVLIVVFLYLFLRNRSFTLF